MIEITAMPSRLAPLSRRSRFSWLMATITFALLQQVCAAQVPSAAYTLHAGDKLLVGLFDDPKLVPQELTIAPDGKFSFPLIGEVIAGGKTTEQVRVEIETRLKKYVADPSVVLVITEVKGNVVYVVGQVNKPGAIEMNPTINVLQALSIAGGLDPYAKADSILVIRHTTAGQSVLDFHYGQVIGGRNLQQNVDLQSGDVVVVP